MRLHIKVKPGASKDLLEREVDGSLKLRIQAPPVDGKANIYLIKFLAKEFDIPKSSISIVKGVTSSFKTIEIEDAYIGKVTSFVNRLILPNAD